MGKRFYFSDKEIEELKTCIEARIDDTFTPSIYTDDEDRQENREGYEILNNLYEKLNR